MTIKVALLSGVAAGEFNGPNSGTVQPNSDNTFSIDPRDASFALHAGYVPVYTSSQEAVFPVVVRAAEVGRISSSASLANGTLTIANQPDVPRQMNVVVAPGSPGITAGTVTVVYVANDGSNPQTDILSLVGNPNSLPFSVPLTKGVMSITSATVAGLVGGTSPGIQIDTTAVLAVPVPALTADITNLKEATEGGNQTTLGAMTTAGLWTPHVAPVTGTHTYSVWYSTVAPS